LVWKFSQEGLFAFKFCVETIADSWDFQLKYATLSLLLLVQDIAMRAALSANTAKDSKYSNVRYVR
jgi:hypothetical protein